MPKVRNHKVNNYTYIIRENQKYSQLIFAFLEIQIIQFKKSYNER